MKTLRTERLILRAFKESDYDDLYEFLSQLENDEFEGYPGITYENGREHLKYRLAPKNSTRSNLRILEKSSEIFTAGTGISKRRKSVISSINAIRERDMPVRLCPQ